MKLCPYLSHFSSAWTEFDAGDVHNNLLSDFEFRVSRRCEGNNLIIGYIVRTMFGRISSFKYLILQD